MICPSRSLTTILIFDANQNTLKSIWRRHTFTKICLKVYFKIFLNLYYCPKFLLTYWVRDSKFWLLAFFGVTVVKLLIWFFLWFVLFWSTEKCHFFHWYLFNLAYFSPYILRRSKKCDKISHWFEFYLAKNKSKGRFSQVVRPS